MKEVRRREGKTEVQDDRKIMREVRKDKRSRIGGDEERSRRVGDQEKTNKGGWRKDVEEE